MLMWLTLSALANDLPDEGFESGSLEAWDATWGAQTGLATNDPIEDTASLGIALASEAQAGLYHDVNYAGGVVVNASACVAPDPARPPSGDVYATLVIEIYDGQGNAQSRASDVAMSNLSDVGELTVSATAVDGGMARFVLLVTSDSGADEGGFFFDRVWMGEGEAPGCADLMPEPEAGDSDGRGDTDDPETVESECSCASTGSPLGPALFLPVVALLRRRRVSC